MRIVILVATAIQAVTSISLDTSSSSSVKNVSSTLAFYTTSYYTNNGTNTSTVDVGLLSRPYYWWESAAVWGSLIDYWAYTGDTSYNPSVTQALLAQTGSNNNYLPAAQTKDLGNDDQAFWALACMDALEYGFPSPSNPTWLELATNVWNTQVPRWDTQTCDGGLRWQIFAFNAGYNYKNSDSNAALFQLSARLARYTGNTTYIEWAEKSYNWMSAIGLIDASGAIFDGTDAVKNCTEIDHLQWTYLAGSVIYGASVMYNNTNGSSIWQNRLTTLMNTTSSTFFNNSVMVEVACELNVPSNCNSDQLVFKSFLAKWLAKSAVLAPFLHGQVSTLLTSSAQAAARVCSATGYQEGCGQKWYVTQSDNVTGVGQDLSALSVVQSLLLLNGSSNAASLKVLRSSDGSGNVTVAPGSGGTSNGTNGSTGTNGTYRGGADHIDTNIWTTIMVPITLALAQALLLL